MLALLSVITWLRLEVYRNECDSLARCQSRLYLVLELEMFYLYSCAIRSALL